MAAEVVTELNQHDRRAVAALAARAEEADGIAPLSEQTLLNLAGTSREVSHWLVREEGKASGAVIGYGQKEAGSAEATVDPAFRGRGIGRELVSMLLAEDANVAVWAHGDLPPARHLASKLGLGKVRDLWLMAAPAPSPAEVAEPDPLAGINVRTFDPRRDGPAWVEVNALAFATHPEQGKMTLADLEERMKQPWFDPEAFLLAEDSESGELLASMWLKIEGTTGEIYALGVRPSAQGRRLGTLLTAHAMAVFASRSLDRLELYVEGENAAAISTYRRAGFTKERADVQFART